MKNYVLPLVGFLFNYVAAQSTSERFYADRLHSSVEFTLSYIEIMELDGTAEDYYCAFDYNSAELASSEIFFLIDASSLNTGMVNRDKDLRSAKYLETETFPSITFRSHKFYGRNDSTFALGDLKIKETTREVELPFQIVAERQDRRKLLVVKAGPLMISRTNFGVGDMKENNLGKLLLGDEVSITAEILFRSIGEDEKDLRQKFELTESENLNLSEYEGTYRSDRGLQWTVENYDDNLFFVWRDAAVFRRMTPLESDQFIVDDIGNLLEFKRDPDSGKITKAYYRNGSDLSKATLLNRVD